MQKKLHSTIFSEALQKKTGSLHEPANWYPKPEARTHILAGLQNITLRNVLHSKFHQDCVRGLSVRVREGEYCGPRGEDPARRDLSTGEPTRNVRSPVSITDNTTFTLLIETETSR